VQCAEPANSGPVSPVGLRAEFDAMEAACRQRGSTLDHVQWTRSRHWVEALTCNRSDQSLWDLNICGFEKDIIGLRKLLWQRSELPVSCTSDLPSENAGEGRLCDNNLKALGIGGMLSGSCPPF
jgi:hypothetical protein